MLRSMMVRAAIFFAENWRAMHQASTIASAASEELRPMLCDARLRPASAASAVREFRQATPLTVPRGLPCFARRSDRD